MTTAFAEIAFTPSVKAAQLLYGSREANSHFELAKDRGTGMTEQEIKFISERDSFYQATLSETGWPYVQHRGGPKGFLKVLDEHTLGFADFRGNRQYLSIGNLNFNDRISMILMDYPNRRRLKLWGLARIVHESEDPELVLRLTVPSYRARVERGIVIDVKAMEWNCPQHITQRYSKAELSCVTDPLLEEIRTLKAQITALTNERGSGKIE